MTRGLELHTFNLTSRHHSLLLDYITTLNILTTATTLNILTTLTTLAALVATNHGTVFVGMRPFVSKGTPGLVTFRIGRAPHALQLLVPRLLVLVNVPTIPDHREPRRPKPALQLFPNPLPVLVHQRRNLVERVLLRVEIRLVSRPQSPTIQTQKSHVVRPSGVLLVHEKPDMHIVLAELRHLDRHPPLPPTLEPRHPTIQRLARLRRIPVVRRPLCTLPPTPQPVARRRRNGMILLVLPHPIIVVLMLTISRRRRLRKALQRGYQLVLVVTVPVFSRLCTESLNLSLPVPHRTPLQLTWREKLGPSLLLRDLGSFRQRRIEGWCRHPLVLTPTTLVAHYPGYAHESP
mmetsp:Transcript_14764/g.42145  ORF Transcript_14764/g.42145 Transcript_14764/m.42145 type:complete len:348 (+) Transcript_14764:964-2007(+)